MANDTHYGLAAYVWTRDLDAALSTAHALEAGWVQVNQGGGQIVGQSYGGYKQSGLGREVSLEGMLAGFTQTKQVNVRLRLTRTRTTQAPTTTPTDSRENTHGTDARDRRHRPDGGDPRAGRPAGRAGPRRADRGS